MGDLQGSLKSLKPLKSITLFTVYRLPKQKS